MSETRITVENPTCWWCPSWDFEDERCLAWRERRNSDEPVCGLFGWKGEWPLDASEFCAGGIGEGAL